MVRLLHYSDVENAYDDPERIGRLAGAISERRGEDTLVVGTGDNTAPGALSLATRGGQARHFFEAVDPDADVLGNHDFDYGPTRTRELVESTPQPWVTANVFQDGRLFGAEEGAVPSTVVECGGVSIGLVGVTDPNTPEMCPPANDLAFEDPLAHVRQQVARLDVDHVVVLSHTGNVDLEIARQCDVDAVLGGHIHEERIEWIDEVPCTRPGANGTVLLEIALEEGRVHRHETADAPVHEGVAEAMRAEFDRQNLDEIVATVSEPIDRSRETKRVGETAIGNFVADAYRWAADADVGLQNTDGLRAGPPLDGDVTVGDIVGLVPFDEPVAVAAVDGEQLVEVLAQAEGSRMPQIGDYWHAQISGVTIERGAEIEVRIDGAPPESDRTYRLATTNYLFHSPYEFPALTESDRIELLDVQYDVIADYAREFGIDPTTEGRVRSPSHFPEDT